jgi:hypothetical protein
MNIKKRTDVEKTREILRLFKNRHIKLFSRIDE